MSTAIAVRDSRAAVAAAPDACDVEIVVPVHNEERALALSIHRLHRFCTAELPYTWRLTIADNASTDATPNIARALESALDGVGMLALERKGRGRALRAAWGRSDARVVVYMDVDLSTDLKGLLPLVAPLLCGHSEVAIGSRLAHGARVTRGPRREFISRTYNHILRAALGVRFTDAQCGFKAVRTDALRRLLPAVADGGWFFDTELLVLAQRHGMRIHEVPVDWIDDPDSRVHVSSTAADDLRGVARMLADGRSGRVSRVIAWARVGWAIAAAAPLAGCDAVAVFGGAGLRRLVAARRERAALGHGARRRPALHSGRAR